MLMYAGVLARNEEGGFSIGKDAFIVSKGQF